MQKKYTIKCPHCGYQYLPAEIYYPDEFFGHPTNIIKDDKGDIITFHGNNLNLNEEYTCDKCSNLFRVEANISFKSVPLIDLFATEETF